MGTLNFYLTAFRPEDHIDAHTAFIDQLPFTSFEAALRFVAAKLIDAAPAAHGLATSHWNAEVAGGRVRRLVWERPAAAWMEAHMVERQPTGRIFIEDASIVAEVLEDRAAEILTA